MIQSRRLPQKAKRFSDVRNIKEDFTVGQQDCQSSGPSAAWPPKAKGKDA